MPKATVLIVGATRGLGNSLARKYAEAGHVVYGTARSSPKDTVHKDINWINNVDLGTESAGKVIVDALPEGAKLDLVIVTAGFFGKESFDEPDFEAEVTMYKTSAIGPVFLVHHLVRNDTLPAGSKIILVSSESGSITLRHESEGGGNFAHHASKTALNMVGKLLSLDLKDKMITVGMLHPGFMRTEMTRSVGFDKFWDDGGAVTPDQAADSMIPFIDTFAMDKTGTYWAPRGPRDIGTAEQTIGQKSELPTPLQLPW